MLRSAGIVPTPNIFAEFVMKASSASSSVVLLYTLVACGRTTGAIRWLSVNTFSWAFYRGD